LTPPLVSILIPTYNRAVYLRECLHSALAQSYDAIEILILDDASTDNTPGVVKDFVDDPRVRYIRHEQNVGIVKNWRAGIEACSGDYFCFLHDDDTFEPTFIEKLVQPMIMDSSLIFTFCDHWLMDTEGKRLPIETDSASRAFKRNLLFQGRMEDWAFAALVDQSMPVGATLFRRSIIELDFIDPRARDAIDIWLFYECARLNLPVYYLQDRLMNYRIHPGGMSQKVNPSMEEGHIFRCTQVLADEHMSFLHRHIRLQLAAALGRNGFFLLKNGDHRSARLSLRRSMALNRSNRTYLTYALACGGALGTKVAKTIQ